MSGVQLEQDKMRQLQLELMDSVVPGGMMGGYNEEDFPFFYINQKMLDYLGYEDQDSFIEDIDGLIINCMHPDDRERVNRACEEQLQRQGTYELEYRMCKKDGTYIWVHDAGKKILVDNNREAILSICYDITREKEHNILLENLVDSMNGSMGTYTVEKDGALHPIYTSSSMGRMIGVSQQYYMEKCAKDAMNFIYPADRKLVQQSIQETLKLNRSTSISFRVCNGEGGYTWLNGSYSRAGEIEGKPALRVVFTPASRQFELQQDIIHSVPGGVCLYRWDGKKLHPVIISDQFTELHGGDVSEALSKTEDLNFQSIHPEDQPGYRNYIIEGLKHPGREYSYSFRLWNRKEEHYIWVSMNATNIQQPDGSQLIYASYSNIEKIKAVEAQLRHNEAMLEMTCDFAEVWTFFYDVETRCIYPGKSLQKAFGFQEEEKDFPECVLKTRFIPEESKPIYREMVERVNQGDDSYKTDIQIFYAEGDRHWLRYQWQIIEHKDGRPKLAIGYARIVDDEKQLEARIKMEQKRLLGGDGRLLAYIVSNVNRNRVMEQRTFYQEIPLVQVGLSLKEASKRGSEAILEPKKKEEFLTLHDQAQILSLYEKGTSSVSMEYRRQKLDGTVIWEKNVLNFLREPESGDIFLYEYCYDINKEKLLEEVMLAAVNYDYERFGSISLENGQITMLLPDVETGDYHLRMENFEELCRQYVKENVIEEDQSMFLQNCSLFNLCVQLEYSDFYEFTNRCRNEKGEIEYKRSRFSYYDREKKICLMTRSDVTGTIKKEEAKQKRLQRTLKKEQEATQAKSDFLSRMSHELRTPLNAITGYVELLEQNIQEDKRDKEEELEHIRSVQKATRYLLALIGDILDTQKIVAGRIELTKEKVNAKDYMQNIVDLIQPEADRKKIDFKYERLTRFSEFYYIDGVRLEQVLLNILHNAIKFTPEGGRVRMTAESLQTEASQTVLKFVITDTGIGMSQEFMEKELYQSFSQENHDITSPYEGTGIGLTISRELVKLMGGEIQCSSVKGEGATFIVTIQADTVVAPVKKERRAMKKKSFDLSGIRVLICEDNPMNRDMTKRLLVRMNCQVDVAEDGQIGVQKFQESKKDYYDLILMDLRMPVLDGFQATKAIRALPMEDATKLPILALSANAFEEDIRMTLEAGMNEHIAKPVDARVLCSKIEEYCMKTEK